MSTSTVSSCRVQFYHYTNELSGSGEADLSSVLIEAQREVKSFEYSKNIGQPAGNFVLELTAEYNWKKRVFPGDWLMVSLSNEGVFYPRMLGCIDRVSQFTTRNDRGLLETSYVITGKDFGKVFEKTNIWFNVQDPVRLFLEITGSLIGGPSKNIPKILQMFLNNDIPIDTLKNQPQLNQWKIPPSLSKQLGGYSDKFYSILKQDIQENLGGQKAVKSMASFQGSLWNILKDNSNDLVNEIYVELLPVQINEDALLETLNYRTEIPGKVSLSFYSPTFVLRTKPFARKKSKSILNKLSIRNNVNYFLDLPRVQISGDQIIGSDIGLSDEDRYNYFLATTSTDLLSVEGNINLLRSFSPPFPQSQIGSIQRNGLRLMYGDTEFSLIVDKNGEKLRNNKLLHDWNVLLFEFFNNAIFLETGTIEIKRATPDLKVGKVLQIVNSSVNEGKLFYIEGYTDSWEYPGNWNQTVFLTRGQYFIDNEEKYGFQVEKQDKTYTGQSIIVKGNNPKKVIG